MSAFIDNILDVAPKIYHDDRITKYEYHTHSPYASCTYNNNDEIRIPMNSLDAYTLPAMSLLHVQGSLLTADHKNKNADVKLINNTVAFMFNDIRYEINGTVVCRVQKLGVASTIKNILSLRECEKYLAENAGWSESLETDGKGGFSFHVPLRMLMGFAEDWDHLMLNVKQELILTRASNDVNCLNGEPGKTYSLVVNKVQWKVPHIEPALGVQVSYNKMLASNRPIELAFRGWEMHEYPALPATKFHTWTVKTSSQLEKPRYVVVAFQTGRKDVLNKKMSEFDYCNVHNIRLYLNGAYYPYDQINGDTSVLYDMFCRFMSSYYEGRYDGEYPRYSLKDFMEKVPLFVIDCSKQNDSIKTGSVDVRLDIEMTSNAPANTAAYCLILHDSIVTYTPLTSVVKNNM